MNKYCILCGKSLTIDAVFTGFRRIIEEIIFRRGTWKHFDTCQECRTKFRKAERMMKG